MKLSLFAIGCSALVLLSGCSGTDAEMLPKLTTGSGKTACIKSHTWQFKPTWVVATGNSDRDCGNPWMDGGGWSTKVDSEPIEKGGCVLVGGQKICGTYRIFACPALPDWTVCDEYAPAQ